MNIIQFKQLNCIYIGQNYENVIRGKNKKININVKPMILFFTQNLKHPTFNDQLTIRIK